METLLEQAKLLQKDLVTIRRALHERAETGFALTQTVKLVKEELEKIGCKVEKCGKSGLVTTIGQGEKCILLRADMDGLPLQEQTNLSFACKNGNMHACGHDLHTAMLLGSAKLLKACEKQLKGTVKLLFQPAEELLQGAQSVINAGVLENPKPQVALMLHAVTAVELQTGTVVVASGGVSAPSADYFRIEVKGKSCHGSAPWNGVDALNIACHILIALQEISARELSISNSAVLTVGALKSGQASNVIPDKASLHGTLRAFDDSVRERVKKRVETIAKHTAKAFLGSAKIVYEGGCPTLVNDDAFSSFVEKNLKGLLGEKYALTSQSIGANTKEKSGGSEDFAYISHKIPSVMVAVGAGEKGKGYEYPLHHPKVKFDENALFVGSAVYAHTAFEWLKANG